LAVFQTADELALRDLSEKNPDDGDDFDDGDEDDRFNQQTEGQKEANENCPAYTRSEQWRKYEMESEHAHHNSPK